MYTFKYYLILQWFLNIYFNTIKTNASFLTNFKTNIPTFKFEIEIIVIKFNWNKVVKIIKIKSHKLKNTTSILKTGQNWPHCLSSVKYNLVECQP